MTNYGKAARVVLRESRGVPSTEVVEQADAEVVAQVEVEVVEQVEG